MSMCREHVYTMRGNEPIGVCDPPRVEVGVRMIKTKL